MKAKLGSVGCVVSVGSVKGVGALRVLASK